jgi:thiamine-monophosphate kinase
MPKLYPEDILVRQIFQGFSKTSKSGVRVAAGDDAAIWQPRKDQETILTSDWFLEGTHFLRELHPAESVGWKCLARAASDIAAMGGTPRCFLLNLALPNTATGKWLSGFLGGLRRAASALRCVLAGGDTTRQERILITVTVIGEVAKGRGVLRCGGRPDDLLFVSGRLGEAELGLRLLRKGRSKARTASAALRKHLYPEPRIALGNWLAQNRLASAMMDVSDGLSTDLARLCEASAVGAVISEGTLPTAIGVSPAKALGLALHGGDDYELLFTVPAHEIPRFRRLWKNQRGVPISCIGSITRKKKLLLAKEGAGTEELVPGGWDPFRK